MTAQLTPQALEAIGASGECTAPIFRAPCGKSLSDKQINAALEAWFATDDSHYAPGFHQRMRAAIAAATGEHA